MHSVTGTHLARLTVTVLAVTLAACASPSTPAAEEEPTRPASTTAGSPASEAGVPRVTGTVASGLGTPWGITFLPGGSALVTERDSGRVLDIGSDGAVREVGRIDDVVAEGESGLLGIAVSPAFETDSLVFLYVTTNDDNRILRAVYDGEGLSEPTVILDGIPAARIHDGGRLAFGPDGMLYAATGEAGDAELAQDPVSLGGKILRITPDGAPAPGNPDPASAIYSLGHRNVQGLAFDEENRLWASEFGQNDVDELNLVTPGTNYGWPEVEGIGGAPEFADPITTWPVSEASPSGLAFADGRLWMAALRGERLWSIEVAADGTASTRNFFVGEYGRLRTVAAAPDGSLWLTTSNRDGRGQPGDDDDRILRVEIS
ncbi:PQQ-dependent sugar dehydrogenase [Rhodococcus coprophilus]|uniref:PQQ-dependent sugar dehydrogenase n=1 Tax=Rhodococcus coprophilus TaxID=38310 RepID=UPI0037BB1527